MFSLIALVTVQLVSEIKALKMSMRELQHLYFYQAIESLLRFFFSKMCLNGAINKSPAGTSRSVNGYCFSRSNHTVSPNVSDGQS